MAKTFADLIAVTDRITQTAEYLAANPPKSADGVLTQAQADSMYEVLETAADKLDSLKGPTAPVS